MRLVRAVVVVIAMVVVLAGWRLRGVETLLAVEDEGNTCGTSRGRDRPQPPQTRNPRPEQVASVHGLDDVNPLLKKPAKNGVPISARLPDQHSWRR